MSTVYDHLAQLIAQGLVHVDAVIAPDLQAQVRQALGKAESLNLSAIKALLPETISYDAIRCVRAAHDLEQKGPTTPKSASGENDRVSAVVSWGESRSKENLARLIAALQDSSGNVRRLAASALGKICDE